MRYASLFILTAASVASADWPTWHGGPQRTGCADGKAGPRAGKVVWTVKEKEQFIGSPAVRGDRIVIGSVGALGPGVIRSLTLDGKPVWQIPTQAIPGLDAGSLRMQSIVSAPALVGNYIVIGEGMHQHERTALRCLDAATGQLNWSLLVDSHLEGGPSIIGNRVITGAGGRGVMCLEIDKVVLSRAAVKAAAPLKVTPEYDALLDKELALDVARAAWNKEWAKQIEIAKKDDLPPDDLPRPAPRVLWNAGAAALHVDAAVTVSGDSVFVGSSFIDAEKVGKRVVLALSAKDGKMMWEKPVAFNPWGPPSVAGSTVLVGCSSIRFDPNEVGHAKGEVIAFAASDGKQLWSRALGGGVLSAVAVDGGTGWVTCTDGKLYALDIATGNISGTYDAKAPIFATPAVVAGVVYVADLKGVIHAVDAKTRVALFTLNLGDSLGSVYGSPVLSGGRLYVAGLNGALVCIAD